jgi:Putative beta-barrel porin-2, OmpL-like. bbp2
MKLSTVLFSLIFTVELFSQSDTSKKGVLTMSGFVETYYSYQFSIPKQDLKSELFYNYKRNNTFDINLALLKANYSNENVRANIGFMAGSYAEYNLASESSLAQKIYEANAGVKLSKKHDIWLDAGVLPSHIGLEGILSNDDLALSRSLIAENSPYFETGARLSYTSKNKKWYLATLALNGWQRIKKVKGSDAISFGTQVIYKVNQYHTFNSSTFIGSDKPDSLSSLRYFHDFYWQYSKDRFTSQFTFDFGFEKDKTRTHYQSWYGSAWLVKYNLFSKFGLTGRAEYYNDYSHVLLPVSFIDAISTSFGLEYRISPQANIRLEGRSISSTNAIYQQYFDRYNTQTFLSSALSVWF